MTIIDPLVVKLPVIVSPGFNTYGGKPVTDANGIDDNEAPQPEK